AAQLREGDDAVGLNVKVLNGEGLVLVNQPVQRPLAGAPEQKGAEDRREGDPQGDGRQARARDAGLGGADFDVEHLLALEAAVFGFAMEPHAAAAGVQYSVFSGSGVTFHASRITHPPSL